MSREIALTIMVIIFASTTFLLVCVLVADRIKANSSIEFQRIKALESKLDKLTPSCKYWMAKKEG